MKRISAQQVQTSERFYRVPKVFFESAYYKKMSTEAKFTYSILKDRFELSLKNNWIDKNGDVFLIYTVQELQDILGYGNKKVISLKKELKEFGLLEEVRQGLNQPNLLYLGNVEFHFEDVEDEENSPKPLVQAEVSKRHFQENQGNVKMTLQEVSKRHSNDTEYSDTENKDNSSRKADADASSTQEKSQEFIPTKRYQSLQGIAEAYHDRVWHVPGELPKVYHLKHEQKMQIGKFLADGYVSGQEVVRMIEQMPEALSSPFAYLMKRLGNLTEERRQEERIAAHKVAREQYS
ncbi:replication initiator protein A [Streptococcus cameli]